MSQTTREEILKKLRRRYQSAGQEHKHKLLDQAQELLGYHRKSAIRALRAPTVERGPRILTGRPPSYEPTLLLPWLRPIWAATDYACVRRLVAMLPEWIPAFEEHERRIEVRAMWGRGQAGTLAALQDMEARLPFALLGLDSDNGGEFLNYHVMRWLQKRARPVFMTRSRPYKKDDSAHVEQKNWTHIRQCFGYGQRTNR